MKELRVITPRNGGIGGAPATGGELSFCFVVYLAKDSIFRLRRGLGAVGEKHTTAAGWEGLSLNDNTNAGKELKENDKQHVFALLDAFIKQTKFQNIM